MSKEKTYVAGQEIVPGYTLIKPLGSGMSGAVWVARAAGGMKVAVKIIPLEALGGRKELSALKTIRRGNVRHPNLCPVHGFWLRDSEGKLLAEGETEEENHDSSISWISGDSSLATGDSTIKGTMDVGSQRPHSPSSSASTANGDALRAEELIVVMGLGDGSLYDRLKVARKAAGLDDKNSELDREVACGLDAPETIGYLRAAASAIDQLHHDFDISHNDIKPQNILLLGGGVQVCDFGLATRVKGDFRETRAVFASPAYAAPEVLEGAKYSKPGDQYALAVTYVELRTGVLPFDTTTAFTLQLAKSTGKLKLHHLPLAEEKVVRKALSVDPSQRYASCTEFINELAIAAGVDKRGGLGWKSLAGVGLVALFLGALAIYAFVPTPTAAKELDAAISEFEKFENDPDSKDADYNRARRILRNIIDLSKKYPDEGKNIRQKIETYVRKSSVQLLRKIDDALNDDQLKDQSDVQNISEDLDKIEEALDVEVIGLAPSEGSQLSAGVHLDRLRIRLRHPPDWFDVSRADKSRDAVRDILKSNPEYFNEQQLLAAVALAVTHFEAEPPKGHYVQNIVIDDIVRANSAVKKDGIEPLSEWYVDRWRQMENGFKVQFKAAIDDDNTLPEIRGKIATNWSRIQADASIATMEAHILAGHWGDFKDKFSLFKPKQQDLDESGDLKRRIFAIFLDGIVNPLEAAGSFDNMNAQFAPTELHPFKMHIQRWIDYVSEMATAEKIGIAPAKESYAKGVELAKKLDLQIPAGLVSMLMTAAVFAGPDCFNDNEVREAIEVGSSQDSNHLLSAALLFETDAFKRFKSANRGGSIVSFVTPKPKLKQQLEGDPRSLNLPQSLPPLYSEFLRVYSEFLRGLLHWGEDRLADATTSWKAIHDLDSNDSAREMLGMDRRELIADAFLAEATIESSVADNDILNLRYSDGQSGRDKVVEAAWWLDQLSDSSVLDQYRIQKLLLDVADGGATFDLVQDLLDKVDHGDFKNPNAQMFRAIFEVAKKENLQKLEAEATSVRAAAGALRQYFEAGNVINDDVIKEILNPTADIVLATGNIKQDEGTLWKLAPHLSIPATEAFAKYYLKTDDYSGAEALFEENEGEWKSSLEKFAAILASRAADKVESARYWQLAAKFCRADQEIEQSFGADANALLESYVNRSIEQLRIVPNRDEFPMLRWNIYLLDGYVRYREALLTENEAARIAKFEAAADRFDYVIKNAGTERAFKPILYEALYRKADAHVNLAYLKGHSGNSRQLLEAARDDGKKAVELAEKPPFILAKSDACSILGNVLEDLAHYHYSGEDQVKAFKDAQLNFKEAIKATKLGRSSISHRIALARSTNRYVKACQMAEPQKRQLLLEANAMLDIAVLDENENEIILAVKWHLEKSAILEALEQIEEATANAELAYKRVVDEVDPQFKHERFEAIFRLSQLMLKTDFARAKELYKLLRQIESPSTRQIWKMYELENRIFSRQWELGDTTGLARDVLARTGLEFQRDVRDQLGSLREFLPVLAGRARILVSLGLVQVANSDVKSALESALESLCSLTDKQDSPRAQAYHAIVCSYREALTMPELDSRLRPVANSLVRAKTESVDQLSVQNTQRLVYDLLLKETEEAVVGQDFVRRAKLLREKLDAATRAEVVIALNQLLAAKLLENISDRQIANEWKNKLQ